VWNGVLPYQECFKPLLELSDVSAASQLLSLELEKFRDGGFRPRGWMDLCDQAAAEQDAVRFKALVDEIVVVIKAKRKRRNAKPRPGSGASRIRHGAKFWLRQFLMRS